MLHTTETIVALDLIMLSYKKAVLTCPISSVDLSATLSKCMIELSV